MTPIPPFPRQRGFTLIEVLIALIVLSVSLLGITQLQLTGLRLAQDSMYRTQAALLAFDMSQKMLANKLANQTITDWYANNATTTYSVNCGTSACTASQMADYDLAMWRTMIADRIVGGEGEVTGTSGVYDVSVDWWDRAGVTIQTESVEQVEVPEYGFI